METPDLCCCCALAAHTKYNNDNISETEESDEADNMLDAYNPDPGKVKSLRSGFADDRREFRKQRKLQLMKKNSGNAKESEVSRNKDTVMVKSESNGQKRNAAHLGDTETIKKLKSNIYNLKSRI